MEVAAYFKIIFVYMAFSLCESEDCGIKQIKIKYVSQPLDHFTDSSLSWDMRYLERRSFWKPKGPILIYIGGEFPASELFLKRSGMVRLAMALDGAMFVTEHRFYGGSVPLDVNLEKMMKYLNSRQALADVASLVKMLKRERGFADSKVIVIGVSYSGSLASWMRQIYPELVDAAWASSAPVQAKLDFYKYYEVLGNLYKTNGGETCYKNIETLFNYQTLLFDDSKVEILKKEQNICPNVILNTPIQRQVYFDNYISRLDQHRSPKDIMLICKLISNITDAKRSLHTIEYATDLTELKKEYACDPDPFEYILLNNTNDIAWAWQCCSEFGYFITTSSKKHPFNKNIPLEYSMRKCRIFFGIEMKKSYLQKCVDSTNQMYGGNTPNVTRVVFVNGANDPWHHLGVLKDLSPDTPAVIIKGAGHGDDFRQRKIGDTKDLMFARRRIESFIKKWISQE